MPLFAVDGFLAYLPSRRPSFETSLDHRTIRRSAVQGGYGHDLSFENFISSQSSSGVWWVRVQDIVEISCLDPWPSLRIEWQLPTSPEGEQLFDSRTLSPPSKRAHRRAKQQEAMVEALLTHAQKNRWSCKINIGWAENPSTQWEEVKALPEDQRADDMGAYRSGSSRKTSLVRHQRESILSRVSDWSRSGPELPFDFIAREVVLTPSDVYARFYDGRIARVPRNTLSWIETRRGFVCFRFGRSTWLQVRGDSTDEVVQALEEQIHQGD